MSPNGIAPSLQEEIQQSIRGESIAIVLYGSFARGDQRPNSDVDILQITRFGGVPYRSGRVNVSVYSVAHLKSMAESGDLFALHIITDGVMFSGTDILPLIKGAFKYPKNYEALRSELVRVADLLDLSEDDYRTRWARAEQLARYVIRTWLYSQFAEKRDPIFSMETIASRIPDMRLLDIFCDKPVIENIRRFKSIKQVVENYVGHSLRNRYLSLEAAVVNAWPLHKGVVALGVRLINSEGTELPYDAFTRVEGPV